ncbi:MAG: type II secretion system protein M [Gammaproteobacteria bacterium]|nr:type II secretion system protein M [Gammaproteobacteria bacterium]
MKEWFNNLEQRERRYVSIGSIAVLIMLVYALLWAPFLEEVKKLNSQVNGHRDTLSWMQNNTQLIKSTNPAASTGTVNRDQSLIAVIGETTKNSAMSQSVKRVEENKDNSVRVWLEKAPFDQMIIWLESLQTRYGANITSINIDNQSEVGVVNARLTLERL